MIFWTVCITWSALFLTTISLYLYIGTRKHHVDSAQAPSRFKLVKDFVFIWVLLGLLGLYIISIDRGSSIIFASGNIIVEVILIAYTMKNRTSKGREAARR